MRMVVYYWNGYLVHTTGGGGGGGFTHAALKYIFTSPHSAKDKSYIFFSISKAALNYLPTTVCHKLNVCAII